MKSYSETVDAVFNRIRLYESRKKQRAVLIHRITAICCALAVLSGSLWLIHRTINVRPSITNNNSDNSTGTTAKNQLLISLDPTDTMPSFGVGDIEDGFFESDISNGRLPSPISPALKEKMKQYSNIDVIFSVLVQIIIPYDELEEFEKTNGFFETNEEIIRIEEKLWEAYRAYVDAPPEDPTQKYSTTPDPEKLAAYYAIREEYVKMYAELYGNVDEIENEALRIRVKEDIACLAYNDAMVEWRTFISTTKVITDEERLPHLEKLSNARETYRSIAREWDHLRTRLLDEYVTAFRQQKLTVLSEYCDATPIEFDNEFIEGYYAELTADAINHLSKQGCFSFRMASPDGSVEADWRQEDWND